MSTAADTAAAAVHSSFLSKRRRGEQGDSFFVAE
jgi:hypothetical protein